uniref:Uncharacterized protein n=1 Tax=Anopheles funestus TaxID=62324 RepID=A0A182S143_ANOFN
MTGLFFQCSSCYYNHEQCLISG